MRLTDAPRSDKLRAMRASRVIVVLILVNVLLGLLAASVILTPDYAAFDMVVRKAMGEPRPPERVLHAVVAAQPEWKRQLWPSSRSCSGFCRLRRALMMRFRSEEELLRVYVATVRVGDVSGLPAASRAYFRKDLAALDLPESATLAGMIEGGERTEARRNAVLRRMAERELISAADYLRAVKSPFR